MNVNLDEIKEKVEERLLEEGSEIFDDSLQEVVNYNDMDRVCQLIINLLTIKKRTPIHYHNDGTDYIAFDIKGEGFPDYDDIIKEITIEKNVSLEEIIEDKISDTEFDAIWWDELMVEFEEFKDKKEFNIFEEIAVLGKRGGYWGVSVDSIFAWLEFDRYAYKNYIKEVLEGITIKKIDNIISEYDKEFWEGISPKEANEEIVENILVKSAPENYFELVETASKVNEEIECALNRFRKDMDKIIDDFKSSEKWVEILVEMI